MPKRRNYEIGHGKPPPHGQFQPGQSGNPRGRPRRSRNIAMMMREVFYQRVQITRDGKKVRVPAFEALLLRLMKGGLEGDARSITNLLKIATLLHDLQSREAAKEENADENASAPLEEVDREVLEYFADLVRKGGFGDKEDDG